MPSPASSLVVLPATILRFALLVLLGLALSGPRPAHSAAASGGAVRVEIRDPKSVPVADAVASLVPLDRTPALTPPAPPVAVVQEGEEFHPYVTAIVVGTRVSFPNRDAIAHHVYSISPAKKFDIPRYRGEPKDTVLFDQPGVVSLGCNLHDWMSAYVVVLATPHFGLSRAEGVVALGDLPPGRYRLEVWHPRAKAVVQREVTLSAVDSTTQVIAITLGVDRRIRRAPEGGAGGYR